MGLQSVSTGGDPNSHGAGFLEASQIKVNYRGIPVILFGDLSTPDGKCDDDRHCAPWATAASERVFIRSIGVHRRGDKRRCRAVTVPAVLGTQKVFAG